MSSAAGRCASGDTEGSYRGFDRTLDDPVEIGAERRASFDRLEAVEIVACPHARLARGRAVGVDALDPERTVEADQRVGPARLHRVGPTLGLRLLDRGQAAKIPVVELQPVAVEINTCEGLRLIHRLSVEPVVDPGIGLNPARHGGALQPLPLVRC